MGPGTGLHPGCGVKAMRMGARERAKTGLAERKKGCYFLRFPSNSACWASVSAVAKYGTSRTRLGPAT